MFGDFKKQRKQTTERRGKSKHIKKILKEKDIDEKLFRMFLDNKDISMYDATPELMEEYLNRDNIVEKLAIPCNLKLNEMYDDVNNRAGAGLQFVTGAKYNLTNTQRKQVIVSTKAVIVKNGIVFKRAINNSEDIRIPWEDITKCKIITENRLGVMGTITVDNVVYNIQHMNNSKNIGFLFFDYVETHKKGEIDEGWS